jgi:small subunit ribosomal protein S6e
MVEFKLVIGKKDGKSIQKTLKEPETNALLGLKIGDKVLGDKIGMAGYEFQICGGSDYCGFPMRKDLPGAGRKKVLMVKGIGLKDAAAGIRKRRTICGNTIHAKTVQLNLKVLKEGKEQLVGEAKAEGEEKKTPAKKK